MFLQTIHKKIQPKPHFCRHFYEDVENIEDIDLSLVNDSLSDETIGESPEDAIEQLHEEVQATAAREMQAVLPNDQR